MNIPLIKEAIKRINRSLERHPGDAPWSCVECYHNRPCVDRVILMAAKEKLEGALNADAVFPS